MRHASKLAHLHAFSCMHEECMHASGMKILACEQALSCGVGGWGREEERELAIMSHKFEFRPQYPPQPLRSLAVKI